MHGRDEYLGTLAPELAGNLCHRLHLGGVGHEGCTKHTGHLCAELGRHLVMRVRQNVKGGVGTEAVPEEPHFGDGLRILGGDLGHDRLCDYLSVGLEHRAGGDLDPLMPHGRPRPPRG